MNNNHNIPALSGNTSPIPNFAYSDWLLDLSRRYRVSQVRAAVSVNVEMLTFYWNLGADIVRMEADQPWGSKFLEHLSFDMQTAIPGAKGFSVTNLDYIRRFFKLYAARPIAPQPEGQITPQPEGEYYSDFLQRFPNVCQLLFSVPWGHHKSIMDKFRTDQGAAMFYVRKVAENSWSRSMLEHWIGASLHLREGNAVTNFDTRPEIAPDGDLSSELLKDPYDFSFLTLTDRYHEQELKDALIANIEKYMLEIGEGFCFKGREIPLIAGENERPLDMLFYNDVKRFYLVVEVKVRKFQPADVGQTNAYIAAVNHQLRHPGDGTTVGLIICREKDRVTAQYALEGVTTPIGIADYCLEKFLPADFVSDLPQVEDIESTLNRTLNWNQLQPSLALQQEFDYARQTLSC